jgi:anaerobic magnesium-protoporphyrin IX monomethyl ester cyclase
MKVILINPPSPYLADDSAYPPSGLMYIASSIESMGHEAAIVDLTGGIDWENEVSKLDADLFGITCVTPNFGTVKRIAEILPKNKPIIVGGAHPTFLPNDVLKNIRCDAIVIGEGEIAIKRIIHDLEKGKLKRFYEGGLVKVEDITKPARHLVDLNRYNPGGIRTTPIYTSRGCPYDCAFCSKVTGRDYRMLPISRLLDEVEEVIDSGFDYILFGDDNIGINNERLKCLLTALKTYNIKFGLNQDARNIKEDMLELAAESGCTEISFGIESGSEIMLKFMNKKASIQDNIRAIKLTKKYGMTAKAYFVVNFPGEDETTIQETLDFADKTKPDKFLVSAFAPLPGSPAFRQPEKYGITWMSKDWSDYYLIGKDGDFKPCFTTAELTISRQIYLHSLLHKGLKQICEKPLSKNYYLEKENYSQLG